LMSTIKGINGVCLALYIALRCCSSDNWDCFCWKSSIALTPSTSIGIGFDWLLHLVDPLYRRTIESVNDACLRRRLVAWLASENVWEFFEGTFVESDKIYKKKDSYRKRKIDLIWINTWLRLIVDIFGWIVSEFVVYNDNTWVSAILIVRINICVCN
jgi:hypothetical protein